MESHCSFFGIGSISCGEARGVSEVWKLSDCQVDISNHLASCGLSRSKLTESELILARAGLFNLSSEQENAMTICASHRFKLGRFWRPLRSCQYPDHTGPTRHCKSRHVFNVQLCQEVRTLFGRLVLIGSRKYDFPLMF